MSEFINHAPAIFALRNEISVVLAEGLSVSENGEIQGHDTVAEEIIIRLVGVLSDAKRVASKDQA